MNYVILTDSSADLPWSYYKEHDIPYIPMTVAMGGDTFEDNGSFDAHEFFTKLGQGVHASTSQISVQRYLDTFEEYFRQGKDILLIPLSQGLSGSYRNACIARDEMAERYPERTVHIYSARCASLGMGLLVHEVRKKRDEGLDFAALCAWTDEFAPKIHHLVTVQDLEFLHRGGRISKTSAVVGTILGIKPMIVLNAEGKLIATGKVRGRKQAIAALVDWMDEYLPQRGVFLPTVAVVHGDCLDEAREVMELVKARYTVGYEIIHPLGITIGAHVGSGTLSLFFEGIPRVL